MSGLPCPHIHHMPSIEASRACRATLCSSSTLSFQGGKRPYILKEANHFTVCLCFSTKPTYNVQCPFLSDGTCPTTSWQWSAVARLISLFSRLHAAARQSLSSPNRSILKPCSNDVNATPSTIEPLQSQCINILCWSACSRNRQMRAS
jgi:hypothetical protein